VSDQGLFKICPRCRGLAFEMRDYMNFCESCYFNIVEEYIKWKEKKEHEKKINKMRTMRR